MLNWSLEKRQKLKYLFLSRYSVNRPRDEIISIKKEFQKEYFLKEPYLQYVNGCGISRLGKVKQEDFKLKDGETLDDLCILVTLSKKAPKEVYLPSEYKGIRVFYEVVGPISFK